MSQFIEIKNTSVVSVSEEKREFLSQSWTKKGDNIGTRKFRQHNCPLKMDD